MPILCQLLFIILLTLKTKNADYNVDTFCKEIYFLANFEAKIDVIKVTKPKIKFKITAQPTTRPLPPLDAPSKWINVHIKEITPKTNKQIDKMTFIVLASLVILDSLTTPKLTSRP